MAIYCGHEIQLYDGETGEPQKTGSIYNFDLVPCRTPRVTPKNVWNDYEIRVVGQHYTIIRNGVVINEFDNTPGKQSSRAGDPPTDLRQFLSGFIGLQNHSDADLMEFRNIRVRDAVTRRAADGPAQRAAAARPEPRRARRRPSRPRRSTWTADDDITSYKSAPDHGAWPGRPRSSSRTARPPATPPACRTR